MSKESEDFIKNITEEINKEFKKNVAQILDSDSKVKVEGLSTGSPSLNEILSGDCSIGFVRGRIVEIYGPEQSGKSTLCLHLISEAQKRGWPCAFIDAEHALDMSYAKDIGVSFKSLIYNQPDCGEDALQLVNSCVLKGVPLIVIDSVAALTPQAEIDGEMGKANIGLQARLMGQAMRKLTGIISKSKSIVVFINQIRFKVGVMFGNPETTTGGVALKFASSYRLEVRSPRGGAIKDKSLDSDEGETGIVMKVKVVKNKLHPPFKICEIPIVYGKGFDRQKDLINFMKHKNYFIVPDDVKWKTPKYLFKDEWYTKKGLEDLIQDSKMYEEVLNNVISS